MEEQVRSLDEDSLLKMFLRDIVKIPLLTREEESTLGFCAKAGDIDAVNCLVQSNLRWVLKIALNMWRPGLPLMDMISEGCIGLFRAAKSFDPALGNRLITFAERPVKWRIISLIVDHKKNCLDSLDELVFQDDAEITKKDLLVADDIPADERCFCNDLTDLLDRLNDREKSILQLRFWEEKSLAEIAQVNGLSKAAVGQIVSKALRKLRWSIYEEVGASDFKIEIHESYALSQ